MKIPFSDKIKSYYLLLLLSLFIALTLFFCNHIVSPSSSISYRTKLLEQLESAQSFDEFTDTLFCYETTTDSVTTAYTLKNPASYKIPALEPALTGFSYSQYIQNTKGQTDKQTLMFISDCLGKFPKDSLTKKQQTTYELLEKSISQSLQLCDYPFREELLGSSTGVQANLPVTLCEYPLHSEENVITYLALLEQIPSYFKDIIAYEEERCRQGYVLPDFLLQDSLNNLQSILEGLKSDNNCFTATFEERIRQIENLSPKKKNKYCKKNTEMVNSYVIPAYEELYQYILELCKTAKVPLNTSKNQTTAQDILPRKNTAYGLSTFPKGKEYYSLLVQSATGSSRSVSELISMTDTALNQALGDVLNIAITDQKAYLYYCEHPMKCYYQSPEAILEALALMARKDYPVLSKTPSYTVKTVSESLAPSLSPAFYMIPAIDDYQSNTIYINPLFTSQENGNLFTTLAHEGFPGHLYQTVYFNSSNPDALRQTLDYPGYVEGWATYVEMNAFTFLEYPLEGTSLCRLYQNDTIINLALCSRIDMGVNYEGWTLSDTCQFFEKNGFNSYYAADIYSYVVEAPANYLSYFIGYLEIMDLKYAYKNQEMEDYSEKKFHKRFLDIGPSDFDTLRKSLLE